MKLSKITDAIGGIDEELIEEALVTDEHQNVRTVRETPKNRISRRLGWGLLAAAIVLTVSAAAIALPHFMKGPGSASTSDTDRILAGIGSDHAGFKVNWAVSWENAPEWRFQLRTVAEKYTSLEWEGNELRIKGDDPLSGSLLGEILGSVKTGWSENVFGETEEEELEIRAIKGVRREFLVACGREGDYYAYEVNGAFQEKPVTLGELFKRYELEKLVELSQFSEVQNAPTASRAEDYYGLNATDAAEVLKILSECEDAPLHEACMDFSALAPHFLEMTVTSEALGAYKKALYVSENGYFGTNLFDYAYVYYIGEDAAEQIFRTAKRRAVPSEMEVYEHIRPGIVTEISENAVVIDDSALCVRESDGQRFTLSFSELRVMRAFADGQLKIGDLVAIRYRGFDENGGPAMIRGIEKAILTDGGTVLIPE